MTKEEIRLQQSRERRAHWKRWGPYLSERAWGTVREDYSPNGDAWDFLTHDQARSKAYRWGEDGIGGISDRHQFICFALSMWNGRDPILKERMFGLTGSEGNHGEDVKEYYFYLDSTPTHSYMKFLYKYPQAEFPYSQLVEENRRRGKDAPEFELMDTGVFDDNRYFDVEIEYAKGSPEDILIRINAANRGPELATLQLLPTIWFRNTWSWKPSYEDVASKFWEHFLYIAHAMNHLGDERSRLWNEEDGFYYDVLSLPDGTAFPMKVRSMVGLIPLFAIETLEPETLNRLSGFKRRLEWFIDNRKDLIGNVACMRSPGQEERRMLSIVDQDQLRRVLKVMLDENEFLSPYGVRALSKSHKERPYTLQVDGAEHRVSYEPAESSSGLFGGNSNWRGPIWFPVNYLIIESLQKFHHYLGDDYKVECPTGSGQMMTLWEVAAELSRRLTRIFLRDSKGRRPVFGEIEKFQTDPNWGELILFHEYFHGDTGSGVGASHQTGWTGLVAKLIQQSGE
ncbi:MAG TPA: hypothetical protein VN937_30165 [Blastocatellia bacterium]|nr:hypothetical protein [Blastocatellia bacterium]